MRTTLLLFLVTTALSLHAQKPPYKFGAIPMEDMTMKIYPQDSSAKAVVLFDFGLTYLTRKGATDRVTWYFERHVRIKVLKKEGLSQGTLQNILYETQDVEELEAATYNLENGKIVKNEISKENIFSQNLSGPLRTLSLALPNVKEGSVVEFAYKINSFLAASWTFQNKIPVRLSEYWMMAPANFMVEGKMQGNIPLDIYDEKVTRYYDQAVKSFHFGCKNVPAFKLEPFLSSPENYVAKVVIGFSQELGSWKTLNNRLIDNQNFGKAITSDFLQGETTNLIQGMTTVEQKMSSISNYVKKNFKWNGGKTYIPSSLKEIYQKKSGSCADLNILLASMLEKAGLNVEMVLLSTKDHGTILQTSAMPSQFNYVICLVTTLEKVYYLDATEKYLPYDVVPARCLNGAGLRISKDGCSWIEISSKAKQRTSITAEMKLTDKGSLGGKINYVFDGYDAEAFRKDFFSKGKDALINQLKASNNWNISASEIKDVEANEKSAQASYDVEIGEHANSTGDVIYASPFVSERIESNPFVSASRLYPIDFSSRIEKIYSCKIVVPSGYSVEEAPKSKILTIPQNGAKFSYNVALMGDAINITSIFQINKAQFPVTEYELLREFYSQVVAKQAEQIVFRKK